MSKIDEANEYVPNDYMPADPILPSGFNYAQVFMNGRQVSMAPPNDPALSFGNTTHPYNSGPSAQLRLLALMADQLGNKTGYAKVVTYETRISNVVVKKIIPNVTGVGCDVYLTYDMGENSYWAKIIALGSVSAETVMTDANVQDKNTEAKVKGYLKQLVKNWMAIPTESYTVDVENMYGYDQTGNVISIKKNAKVSVAWTDKDDMKAGIIVDSTTLEVRAPLYFYLNYYLKRTSVK